MTTWTITMSLMWISVWVVIGRFCPSFYVDYGFNFSVVGSAIGNSWNTLLCFQISSCVSGCLSISPSLVRISISWHWSMYIGASFQCSFSMWCTVTSCVGGGWNPYNLCVFSNAWNSIKCSWWFAEYVPKVCNHCIPNTTSIPTMVPQRNMILSYILEFVT